MKRKQPISREPAALRRLAEERLRAKATEPGPSTADADTLRLLHELQVHQIELELQNEKLNKSRGELESALERYADFYDFAPTGYFTLGNDGTIREANLAGARLLGTERSHLLARRFESFVAAPARLAYRAFLQHVKTETGAKSCELDLVDAVGRPWFARIEARAAVDRETCRLVVMAITERQQTGAALRESEERLRLATEAAGFGTYTYDLVSGASHWSPELKVILGVPPDQPLPLDADRLFTGLHSEDRAAFLAAMTAANDPHGDGLFRHEYRVIHPGGAVRWLQVRGRTAFGGEGAARHAVRAAGVVLDITERKRIEVALSESEARYHAVVEDQTEVICRFKADGTFTFVNDVYCRFFGKPRRELLDRKWQPQAFAEDVPHIEARLRTLSPSNPVVVVENRVYSGSGEVRWMQFVNRAFYDAAGQLVETQAVGRDITERKQAEEELRESEATARARADELTTVSASTLAITFLAHDRECRRMTSSRAALRLLRLPDGANTSMSAPPDERPGTFRALKDGRELRTEELPVQLAAATGKAVKNFELTLAFSDGSARDIVGDAVPLFDLEGKVRGAVGAFLDITERKRAEAALGEAYQFNQQIIAVAQEGIVVYGCDSRYQIWNPYMERLTGIPAAEILGRHPLEVFPFLREVGVMEMIEEALAGKSPQPRDFPFQVPQTGRSGWSSDWTAPLRNAGGVIIGAVGMVRDITARKRVEDELRGSQGMLRTLAAHLQSVREDERTRVAREIHDVLAQELTRLKIDLVWLQRRLAKPGPATAPVGLAARVAEMIQMTDTAIFSVQRIATGLRPAVLDSLGLGAAVEWQARDFQAHAGIQCQASVPEEELPVDRDTATAAFRILQESLTNVQRHAHATRVEVSLRREADQLVLRVEDNGGGIRAEALTSPMSIGLAGMRERALLLDGLLEIRSQPGAGTTIEMRVPMGRRGTSDGGRATGDECRGTSDGRK